MTDVTTPTTTITTAASTLLSLSPCFTLAHPTEPNCYKFYPSLLVRMFKNMFGFYFPYYTITFFLRKKVSLKSIVEAVESSSRSSGYMTLSTVLFGILLCISRNTIGTHNRAMYYICSIVAHFVFIFVEKARRRKELALYMGAVALEALFVKCVARGWVKPIKNGIPLLFSTSYSVLLYYHYKNNHKYLGSTVRSILNIVIGHPKSQLGDFENIIIKQLDRVVATTEKTTTPITIPTATGTGTGTATGIATGTATATPTTIPTATGTGKATGTATTTAATTGDTVFSLKHVISGAVKMLVYGYGIFHAVGIIKILFLKRKPKQLLSTITNGNMNAMQLGLYLACLSGGSRGIPILFRKFLPEDLAVILSGFVTGISSLLWNSTDIATIICVRAMEAIVNHGVNIKLLPEIPFFVEFLESVIVSILVVGIIFERYSIRLNFLSFMEKATTGALSHFSHVSPALGKEYGIPSEIVKKGILKSLGRHTGIPA